MEGKRDDAAACCLLPCPNPLLQVRKTGQVVRAMCIMSHPIPSTNDSHSVQIILPQKQLNRRHGAQQCRWALHPVHPCA